MLDDRLFENCDHNCWDGTEARAIQNDGDYVINVHGSRPNSGVYGTKFKHPARHLTLLSDTSIQKFHLMISVAKC